MPIPVASFTKVVNSLSVSFTDTSTNTPTGWLWDFGDSSQSTQQNPVHIYAAPGIYNVILTATNASGSNSVTIQTVVQPPVAQFNFAPSGLTVQFQDVSANSPTNWTWNFGDGSPTDNTQNPSHTYSADGTYTVSLTVTSANGSSTTTRTINVSVNPVLPLSLRDFALIKAGGIAIDTEAIDAYIVQWQLYIGPLVNPPIDTSNILNENAYPPLANALIASLAAWSAITQKMQQITVGGTDGGGSGSSTSTSSSSGGLIKSIETGPAKVEFQNSADLVKTVFSNKGSSSNVSSFFQTFTNEICMLARRIGIDIPQVCEVTKPPVIGVRIIKVKKPLCKLPYHADGTIAWGDYPVGTFYI